MSTMSANDAHMLELEVELQEAYILNDKKRAAYIEEQLKEFYENMEDE